LNVAVSECILGSLSFNGQRCTAIKIIHVHKEVADEFLKLLSEGIAKMKFGLPWTKGVSLTPVAEPGKPAYLKECIDDACQWSASIERKRW
jgi:glyceraldehyde-3-phosphate dehydrogenase (NADP+)